MQSLIQHGCVVVTYAMLIDLNFKRIILLAKYTRVIKDIIKRNIYTRTGIYVYLVMLAFARPKRDRFHAMAYEKSVIHRSSACNIYEGTRRGKIT